MTTPENVPPLYWLLGLLITVGVPALSALTVALVQRPVRRDARQANQNAAAAADHAQAAAQSAAHAATELTPNHGSSAKDQTTRIEQKLDELTRTVAEVQRTGTATSRDVGGIREEIRTERRERVALAERTDEQVATERRERIALAERLDEHVRTAAAGA